MNTSTTGGADPREIWEGRYTRQQGERPVPPPYEPWLESRLQLLPAGGRLLDLGCGSGADSNWLTDHGFRVIACDFSYAALLASKERQVTAGLFQQDLREGLSIATGSLDGIVANLSLHYFPWSHTVELVRQARECLKPEGMVLARFNSVNDVNFGAEGYPQVSPNAFLVKGLYKRYFDRESLETLFSAGWKRLSLEELAITRYGPLKVCWEVVAVKVGHPIAE